MVIRHGYRLGLALLFACLIPPLAAQPRDLGEAEPGAQTERQSKRRREEAAYPVTTARVDPDLHLEIGGLAVVEASEGPRVIAVTRRGDVYAFIGFAGEVPSETPRVLKVGEGLHEPLGLLVDRDGSLLCACRSELMRLVDRDGDSIYETYEVVSDFWDISGNYHEYNFGPAATPDWSFWITTNKPFGNQPFGKVEWRGYALRIQANGDCKPMAAGLRSPAGIGTSPAGEVFYTDNQGEWCGASKLSLLSAGSYHGHPHVIASTDDPAWTFPKPKRLPDGQLYSDLAASNSYPQLQMPAVWFPYDKMGRSPAEFVWDRTGGKFGPFGGQIFVADQYEAAVFRVDLERVRGHWQGACFRFRDGLQCGATRLEFTPSGALLVGQTDRGWGAKGPVTEGLQRIDFSGAVPFEIHTMRLLQDGRSGFALRFTHGVDRESIKGPVTFEMESYTYSATSQYGSDELDRRALKVDSVKVHEDGRGVDLEVDGLREGYVHELRTKGLKSIKTERSLLHPNGYYTLIKRP